MSLGIERKAMRIRNTRSATSRSLAAAMGLGIALACGMATTSADDTEIFFGHTDASFENNPNILFVLDNSGSMSRTDNGVEGRRIDRMRTAMRELLDRSNSFNVGLSVFQGANGGAAIRYPIGWLEGTSESVCEGGICPDEMAVSRPVSQQHIAVQNDQDNSVLLNNETLTLATVPVEEDTKNMTTAVTKSVVATSDVFEATVPLNPDFPESFIDNNTIDWFWSGTEGASPGRTAYRFDNVELPRNAIVQDAYITFTRTALGDQDGALSVRIHAESTSFPAPYTPPSIFGNYESLLDRGGEESITAATVSWNNVPPITAAAGTGLVNDVTNNKIESADVSTILTEVAGLNQWASGNSVSFLLRPTDEYIASADSRRRFYGAGAIESLRPVLTFSYITSAESETTGSLNALANAHQDVFEETSTGIAYTRSNLGQTQLFHVGDGYSPRQLALRFDTLDIPVGADITSARIRLRSPAAILEHTTHDPLEWTPDPAATTGIGQPGEEPGGGDEPDLGDANAEPVVSMTISAEKTSTPAPYALSGLAGRELTANLQTWTDLEQATGAEFISPDISEVISEVTELPEWTPGDAISLVLSPSDYISTPENIQSFWTSTVAAQARPELDIAWNTADAGIEEAEETLTTAIRFDRVYVPPHAEIKSARIVFTAAATTDSSSDLTIAAEANGAPELFSTADNDIGMRTLTNERQPWLPEPWDVIGTEYATSDLSTIVSEVTTRTDWCGGNSMVFMISGTGDRMAEGFANTTSNVPKLEITYNPSSVPTTGYCSNASVALSLSDGPSDAVQSIGGPQNTGAVNVGTSSNLNGTGPEQSIGLHFRDLIIPKDTRIVSAALRMTPRNDLTDISTLGIQIHEVDNSVDFLASTIEGDGRAWSNEEVTWNLNGPVGAGEPVVSSDITDLLQSIISRGGWESGNDIALRIRRKSGGHRHFISRNSDETLAAELVIYYESERNDASQQFREALKQEVDIIKPIGNTPLTSALYESVRYFRGDAVEYGTRRGNPDVNNRNQLRVSHPFSYNGGQVSRSAECSDLDLNSNACISEEITGSPVYESPVLNQCQTNHIVFLTDGRAYNDTDAQDRIKALTGSACDEGYDNDNEHCGRELAEWVETTDQLPQFDGVQTIEIHSVALALAGNPDNANAIAFLQDIATEQGGYYEASSTEDLLTAFRTIFTNVSKTDTSFVSPSVTVSSQNRLKNRDDVYFSLFKPEATARWGGNLKRYRAGAEAGDTADLFDMAGNLAVDPETGEFKETARSWWSSTADGGNVAAGGAAEQLDQGGVHNDMRRVTTFTGLADNGSDLLLAPANEFDRSNARIDPALFDVPPPLDTNEDYFATLFDWSRGQDVLDQDSDGNTTETRAQMGDPMHSQPVLLNYASGTSIVFVATNEGYLHAINSETGKEVWSWIPQELLKNLHDFFQNSTTRSRPYGLDGGITTWVDDTDRDGLIDADERAVLYLGMRRGGNSYYALDVTNINQPRFMWRIAGGTETSDLDPTTADGEFAELGQSWSQPVRTRVIDGDPSNESNIRDVLIFGGGYSSNQDPSPDGDPANEQRSSDGVGRAIFIVDALSGKELWRADHLSETHMRYSIPSQVTSLDMDFDGIADQLYVGDMGGQVWRFDFNNNPNSSDSLASRITGDRIALLASDEPGQSRRFYYPPSVSLINADGRQQLAITIGSGWRAHPLDTAVQDRLYSIRSPHVFGAPVDSTGQIDYPEVFDESVQTTAGFSNVTDNIAPTNAEIARGWYIDLGVGVDGADDNPGEKSLSSPLTADGKVIFTSYRPESDAEVCAAAIGSSVANVVNVVNGAPTNAFRLDGEEGSLSDRHYELSQAGLAPGASILFHENTEEATVNVGTEKLDIDIGELRRRTFWQEIVEGDID